jgi:hypothetical protein
MPEPRVQPSEVRFPADENHKGKPAQLDVRIDGFRKFLYRKRK